MQDFSILMPFPLSALGLGPGAVSVVLLPESFDSTLLRLVPTAPVSSLYTYAHLTSGRVVMPCPESLLQALRYVVRD